MLVEKFYEGLKQSQERSLDATKLLGLVNQLTNAGQIHFAPPLYRMWLAHNADSPFIHAIYFNYGVVLSNLGDMPGAENALKESIQRAPNFFPPYLNLGFYLEKVGRVGEALIQWNEIVKALPSVTSDNVNFKMLAIKQMGRVYERNYYAEQAEVLLQQVLDLDPTQWDVLQHLLSVRQGQCKWPVVMPWGKHSHSYLMNGFSALTLSAHTDDPLLLLGNAHRYCKNNIGQPDKSFADRHFDRRGQKREGRLRIGYLSSDLRGHAVGYLSAEIFELHDRAKVEVFGYYCGIKANDNIQARIKQSVEHWLDLDGMTDEDVAQRLLADGIDILVDLNGYTNGAQLKMLSMRPAPVIVNWLGFPGSMGTPFHDYIIADDFIIPKENEIFFSEKVVRLPCYQPNDRQRVVSNEKITRGDVGLPDNAMVYCCFNGQQKITSWTWQRWISILQQTPGSVLWLLEGVESGNKRLRDMLVQAGIASERLIFAPRKANAEHLARYTLADLFLDTMPYGAHTTSSDALWMGVPVITLAGRSFASRVCGSLLRAAGLGELICETPEQFVATAVALGRDHDKRNQYRAYLRDARDSSLLFDTPRLVAALEELYRQMWRDFETGNLRRPDLTNLEIYNEIGVELAKDLEGQELSCMPNYREMYEAKLAEKDRFWHLSTDGRLWTEGTQQRLRKV